MNEIFLGGIIIEAFLPDDTIFQSMFKLNKVYLFVFFPVVFMHYFNVCPIPPLGIVIDVPRLLIKLYTIKFVYKLN